MIFVLCIFAFFTPKNQCIFHYWFIVLKPVNNYLSDNTTLLMLIKEYISSIFAQYCLFHCFIQGKVSGFQHQQHLLAVIFLRLVNNLLVLTRMSLTSYEESTTMSHLTTHLGILSIKIPHRVDA